MIFITSLLAILGVVLLGATPASSGAQPVENTQVAEASGAGVSAYLQGAISDLAGDPTSANKGYMAALAEDPDNLTLRQRVLELSMMEGNIANAVRLAKSLPEVEQTTMSRLVVGIDLAHEGKIKEAKRQVREAAKQAPSLLQFELLMAYLDYADGIKVEDLVARIEMAQVPGVLEGRRQFHIGRLWLKASNYEKALMALEKAHAAEPTAIFTTLLLGQTYVHQGETDKAEVLFAQFAENNPAVGLLMPTGAELIARKPEPFASTVDEDLAATLFDFGLVVWAEGVLGPARQLISMALWLDPEQPYYRYYAAILMEMGNDFAAALEQYEMLVDDPNLGVGARLRLAEVHFKMGEQERGWKEALVLAKKYPQLMIIKKTVAQLAYERGDFERAAEEYTALLNAVEPEDKEDRVQLLFARGAAHERGGEHGKAEADLKAALTLDPANAQILNYLGFMWVDLGTNLDEAFVLLKKAHLLAPDDGAITDSVGWAYYKRQDYETAVKYLEMAVEQDPESAEITDHLADAYAKMGRAEDAQKFWRLALELLDKSGQEPRKGFRDEVEDKLSND